MPRDLLLRAPVLRTGAQPRLLVLTASLLHAVSALLGSAPVVAETIDGGSDPVPGASAAQAVARAVALSTGTISMPKRAAEATEMITPSAATATAGARWVWPMSEPHPIVQEFKEPPHRYGPGHRGIDISGSGEVVAVEGGTVRFAGTVAGRGVVSILHSDGLLSTYEPVAAEVAPGQIVVAGQRIGALEPAGAHGVPSVLHLGARTGEDYRDPRPLLQGARPSVLLPLSGRT